VCDAPPPVPFSNSNVVKKMMVVSRLCAGGEVFSRIESKGIYTEADASALFAAVATAVRTLHDDLRMLHRDLKPQNILLRDPAPAAEVPVIADFGMAIIVPKGESQASRDKGKGAAEEATAYDSEYETDTEEAPAPAAVTPAANAPASEAADAPANAPTDTAAADAAPSEAPAAAPTPASEPSPAAAAETATEPATEAAAAPAPAEGATASLAPLPTGTAAFIASGAGGPFGGGKGAKAEAGKGAAAWVKGLLGMGAKKDKADKKDKKEEKKEEEKADAKTDVVLAATSDSTIDPATASDSTTASDSITASTATAVEGESTATSPAPAPIAAEPKSPNAAPKEEDEEETEEEAKDAVAPLPTRANIMSIRAGMGASTAHGLHGPLFGGMMQPSPATASTATAAQASDRQRRRRRVRLRIVAQSNGSPPYMAPELFVPADGYDMPAPLSEADRFNPDKVPELPMVEYSTATDTWALGCFCYELLSGQFIYEDLQEYQQLQKEAAVAAEDGNFGRLQALDEKGRASLAQYEQKKVSGDWTFYGPLWAQVSESAKDLIRGMLHPDTEKRLTLDEVLAHPWVVTRGEGATAHLSAAISNIKRQNAKKKLKAAAAAIVMSNKHKLRRELRLDQLLRGTAPAEAPAEALSAGPAEAASEAAVVPSIKAPAPATLVLPSESLRKLVDVAKSLAQTAAAAVTAANSSGVMLPGVPGSRMSMMRGGAFGMSGAMSPVAGSRGSIRLGAMMSGAGPGALDIIKFRSIMADVGITEPQYDLGELFSLFDSDRSGGIDPRELVAGLTKLCENKEDAVRACFDLYDENGDGSLSLSELVNLLQGLNVQLGEAARHGSALSPTAAASAAPATPANDRKPMRSQSAVYDDTPALSLRDEAPAGDASLVVDVGDSSRDASTPASPARSKATPVVPRCSSERFMQGVPSGSFSSDSNGDGAGANAAAPHHVAHHISSSKLSTNAKFMARIDETPEVALLVAAFERMDENSDGQISFEEFKKAVDVDPILHQAIFRSAPPSTVNAVSTSEAPARPLRKNSI
jgi:serine/threonine protein kinase/Ca2+-binding EF-hand superfamily protein